MKNHFKSFPQEPGAGEAFWCGKWNDGEGGIECYSSMLYTIANGWPYLAEVEVQGRSSGNAWRFIKAEAIKVIRVWRWTLGDSLALAQFAAEQAINAADKLYGQIGKNKVWQARDIDTFKKFVKFEADEMAEDAACQRFKRALPSGMKDLAHSLTWLFLDVRDVLESQDATRAQKWAAWAACRAAQVMAISLDDPERVIEEWIKRRLNGKS